MEEGRGGGRGGRKERGRREGEEKMVKEMEVRVRKWKREGERVENGEVREEKSRKREER